MSGVRPLQIGILIFDGVEVLDFAGPFEVFSRTRLVPGLESRRDEASAPFRVFTLAPSATAITATGGLKVIPDHTLDAAPALDVLVVPGGFGVRRLLEDDLGDRLLGIQGTPQVAPRQAQQVPRVLHGEGAIQAVLCPQAGRVGAAAPGLRCQHRRRLPRQHAQYDKHQGDHAEQDGHYAQEALDDVVAHRSL